MAQSANLTVMINAVRKAARGVQRDFGEIANLQVSVKGPGNFVTAADKRCEKVIREELEKARPGYSFLMEESGSVTGSDADHRFIIDPIDGTTNFIHSIPFFALTVALERKGDLLAAVTYNPISDELFTAERGQGAWLNGAPLKVSGARTLIDSLLCTGFPYSVQRDAESLVGLFGEFLKVSRAVRRLGSAAIDLAYVAAGRLDGFWEQSLHPWDVAAGALIIQEAGGIVTDLAGGPYSSRTGNLVATNGHIHAAMVEIIQGFLKGSG